MILEIHLIKVTQKELSGLLHSTLKLFNFFCVTLIDFKFFNFDFDFSKCFSHHMFYIDGKSNYIWHVKRVAYWCLFDDVIMYPAVPSPGLCPSSLGPVFIKCFHVAVPKHPKDYPYC